MIKHLCAVFHSVRGMALWSKSPYGRWIPALSTQYFLRKFSTEKAHSLAQKPLTDNALQRYDSQQVTNIVINGVWEWAGPRFAVW